MTNLIRPLGLFALTLIAILSAGCTARMESAYFKSNPTFRGGRAITEEKWTAMQASADQQESTGVRANHTFLWPLPTNFSDYRFSSVRNPETGDLERARLVNFTWNDIGTPFLLTALPWRIAARAYQYERGTDLPVAKKTMNWSPFLFRVRETGPVDGFDMSLAAKGVPLLFSDLQYESKPKNAPSEEARVNLYLWTLGPAHFVYRSGLGIDDAPTTHTERFRVSTPLLLGGGLGLVLWANHYYEGSNSKEPQVRRVIGHGPFAGGLGYFDSRYDPTPEGARRAKNGSRKVNVVGGALWHHYTAREAVTGKRIRSRSGPLWTMFGWGHDGDRFRVRILFVPI